MRVRLACGVIGLAALAAIAPMLFAGPSCGHDFDFHLLSWLEAANQMAHGGYPHWAFTPAYNAGEPRFLFYPPLSWLLGAGLGLVLPWAAVPLVFTWVCLTGAGLAGSKVAREYVDEGAATLVAVGYLANPYVLFTAYERTAYGELLAAVWMPLLLAAALRARVRVLGLAVPIALLWLTNAPAAVMGCYAVAVLLALRLVLVREGWGVLAGAVGGAALGLALPAFYLLPAAYERRWIQSEMAMIGGMRIVDNTLFHHMLPATDDAMFHDAVLRMASWIAVGLLVAIALAGAMLWRRREWRVRALLGLAVGIAVLLTPLALPVWAHVPELAYLQFPWRLCALMGTVLLLLVAWSLPQMQRSRALVGATVLGCVLIVPAWRIFHQRCYAEDTVQARVALFHSPAGTESTDEYTPADADADALRPHDPGFWSVCLGGDVNVAAPVAPGGPVASEFTVTLPCPSLLVLNRRQYPAWRVLVNGVAAQPVEPERNDGLLAVAVPAGEDQITLVFARTRDRTLGLMISLLAAVAALWLAWFARRQASNAGVESL